ncbi:23S rRNA (adenine(1618)-N(6))-methyltransferase RlmF [Jejudonia soesokkakensis]|uniref:23S rRNA (adenine(1618)-N(6))-methyltransferase RlmF n=1 Tax=Jejudonia soesokkakensis TaxID=1323432 RepID=UPI0036D2FBB8
MHPNNIHRDSYHFKALIKTHQPLSAYVFINDHGTETIDFSTPEAVYNLNKALLKHHYKVTDWNIPAHYLCPPIPGRVDYLHYIKDLLSETASETVKGLDIGTGANAIYCLLGAQAFNWKMVGCDIDINAVASAIENVNATEGLSEKIEIRHQNDNAHIFKGIIKPDEYFDFTVCNPPFYPSEEAATKETLRKLRNLSEDKIAFKTKKDVLLNFGGQSHELWCNGGEALFIKRMIKQSVSYKNQVGIFTTLVSNASNLNKLYKQLDKLKATHQTIKMSIGNKISHLLVWNY